MSQQSRCQQPLEAARAYVWRNAARGQVPPPENAPDAHSACVLPAPRLKLKLRTNARLRSYRGVLEPAGNKKCLRRNSDLSDVLRTDN